MLNAMSIKKLKISEILQKLMQEKDIHVAELARRTNLKQPTVQRIASGIYQRPHFKSLKPIADFFGISIDQLIGLEPICWLPSKNENIKRVPILDPLQAANWPNSDKNSVFPRSIIDVAAGKNTYAMRMPDASMEPLFPQGSLLFIDPDKTAKDRCYVIIKRQDYESVIFRQLLIDGKERYIKPLSPKFDHFKMALLNHNDIILGVLIQARLDYAD